MFHNQRCKECKVRARQLLEKIYGSVIPNYRIQLGARPEELREYSGYSFSTTFTSICRSIEDSLDLSGQHTSTLAFSRRNRKMIVEFDESWHFVERCSMHAGSHR